ncbi:MAG: Spx/MgsR family RNA polymerase-binding regulatory protein [Gammaproteobacteria bacterium]|nr:Spx/MgsR family RNA polymerase-binding regulatory protein [Gammaproteobacteria bacterium]
MSERPVTRLYGIKNCDSCRKAMKLLNDLGTDYEFVDLRESPPGIETLNRWAEKAGTGRTGWQLLLNRRSRTWKQLDESVRQIDNQEDACQLMEQNPLLVKRPVLEAADFFAVGLNPGQLKSRFGNQKKR